MATSPTRLLRAAVERLGFRVNRLGPASFVVQRPERALELVRLGDGRIGVHLLIDRARARRHPGMLQKRVAEFALHEQVAWVLRATEVNLVLDVGAYVGQFARSVRTAGYRGRIVSFEPIREAYQRLLAESADDPEWTVHPWALGDADSEAHIRATRGTLSSLLPASTFGTGWNDKLRKSTLRPVRVRRLDQVWDEVTQGLRAPVRAYLKLDTQGFDLHVFEGAAGILDAVVALQSEVSFVPIYEEMPRLTEQLAVYEAAGFETAGVFPVSRDAPTLRVIEADLVMVRPGQVRRGRA